MSIFNLSIYIFGFYFGIIVNTYKYLMDFIRVYFVNFKCYGCGLE